ncbi:hypothetical protein COOONC_12240 [Cooperia oncophora]
MRRALHARKKSVKCGFEKNCRVVESAGEALAMLQIGAKKSPFFCQTSVVNFCESYLGLDNRRGMTLEDALRNKRSAAEIVRQLKDIAVRTTHTEVPRVLYISGLSKDSAMEFVPVGSQAHVIEYASFLQIKTIKKHTKAKHTKE